VWFLESQLHADARACLQIKGYPLVNFFVVSLVYTWMSWRLFCLTNTLKAAIVPNKSEGMVSSSHAVLLGSACAGFYLFGWTLERLWP
jgi:hypothetical protein